MHGKRAVHAVAVPVIFPVCPPSERVEHHADDEKHGRNEPPPPPPHHHAMSPPPPKVQNLFPVPTPQAKLQNVCVSAFSERERRDREGDVPPASLRLPHIDTEP